MLATPRWPRRPGQLRPCTPALAKKITGAALDTDGDGVIDRGEWIAFVTEQAHTHGERPVLKLMQMLAKQLETMWVL